MKYIEQLLLVLYEDNGNPYINKYKTHNSYTYMIDTTICPMQRDCNVWLRSQGY